MLGEISPVAPNPSVKRDAALTCVIESFADARQVHPPVSSVFAVV